MIDAIGRSWSNLAGQVCKVACEFVSIVDIPEQLFACCESPKAIAADGIVLSVQSKHLAQLKQPWIWHDAPSSAKARATTPATRTLPCSDAERSILASLIAGEASSNDLRAALEDETMSSSGPRAAVVLALARHSDPSQLVKCPQGLLDFVRCMIREISPAIQLLPSATWDVVGSHLVTPDSPSLTMDPMVILTKYSPIMMRLLTCARSSPRSARATSIAAVVQVFRDLHRIASLSASSVPFL